MSQNPTSNPKISIIIPTLNEEVCLREALANIRRTSPPSDVEVIVVDSRSTDQTASIAKENADKTLIETAAGRAHQMHRGALAATGEILLFLHADSRLPQNWFSAISSAFNSDPHLVSTAFQLRYDSPRAVYWFIAWGARVRTRITGVPHGDQGMAVRRELYFRVGGFPPVPLMEEYFLGRKLKRFGPIVILPEAIRTSTRRYEQNGPIFNALRNAFLIVLYYLGVPPRILVKLYRWSRIRPKIIRRCNNSGFWTTK